MLLLNPFPPPSFFLNWWLSNLTGWLCGYISCSRRRKLPKFVVSFFSTITNYVDLSFCSTLRALKLNMVLCWFMLIKFFGWSLCMEYFCNPDYIILPNFIPDPLVLFDSFTSTAYGLDHSDLILFLCVTASQSFISVLKNHSPSKLGRMFRKGKSLRNSFYMKKDVSTYVHLRFYWHYCWNYVLWAYVDMHLQLQIVVYLTCPLRLKLLSCNYWPIVIETQCRIPSKIRKGETRTSNSHIYLRSYIVVNIIADPTL